MKDDNKYQKLLEKGEIDTRDSLFYRISKKFGFFEKKYWELSRTSNYVIKYLSSIKDANCVVDIGCGSGMTMSFIKRFYNPNSKFYGVDREYNSELPEWVNFINANIDMESIPLESEIADIVITTYVLEHLYRPENLIKEAYRLLKKDGTFLLVTENYTSLFIPDSNWNFYQDHTHVRPWTKRSLSSLAYIYNFDIVKLFTLRPIEYFFVLPFLPILNLFSKSNNNFILYNLVFGSSLCMICKKK